MPIVFECRLFAGTLSGAVDWAVPDRKVAARENLSFNYQRNLPHQGRAYTGALTMPSLTATGEFEALPSFSGAITLPPYSATGSFISAGNYAGVIRMPARDAVGSFLAGGAFSGAIDMPARVVTGAFGNPRFTGTIVQPAFVVTGHFEPDIVQTYRGWPVNLKNSGLTEYTNFSFNSMTRFNGEYLAAGATGLMALSGDDDNGTDIDCRVRFGLTDLNSEQLKRLEEAFATYRSVGDLTFRVIIDGGQTYAYTLAATGNTGMATNRAKVGKAIVSNMWCFEIENVNGLPFDFQDLTLHPVILSRKIGRPPSTGLFTGRAFMPRLTVTGQFSAP